MTSRGRYRRPGIGHERNMRRLGDRAHLDSLGNAGRSNNRGNLLSDGAVWACSVVFRNGST